MKKLLLATALLLVPLPALAGSMTITFTMATNQGVLSAGTGTYTATFTDAGLAAFSAWMIANPQYCPLTGTPPVNPCTVSNTNANTAFQNWAAALVTSIKSVITQSQAAAAAAAAAAAVVPVQ